MRPDFWELTRYSNGAGMSLAVSSNGTLITGDMAHRLKDSGVEHVGISLDGGKESTHDGNRGEGNFSKAVAALEHCVNVGLKSGVRMTVTHDDFSEVPALLDLTAELGIPQFCLYWLVPSGRGRNEHVSKQLRPHQVSQIFDLLYREAREWEIAEGVDRRRHAEAVAE